LIKTKEKNKNEKKSPSAKMKSNQGMIPASMGQSWKQKVNLL
jgi:hypothetical protein